MHHVTALMTPQEEAALHNVLVRAMNGDDPDTAKHARLCWRWLAQVKHNRVTQWQALPDGDPLKEAYREDAGEWTDATED